MKAPDVLRPDKGSGRLSAETEREYLELKDGSHPRTELSPMGELEIADESVELAAEDEWGRCMDPDCHPKPPHPKEEPVLDDKGENTVDLMYDTPELDSLTELPVLDVDGVDL